MTTLPRIAVCTLVACLTSSPMVALASQAPVATPGLEQRFQKSFESRKIPGAAVAIVEDGRVTLARGFGMTRTRGGEAVTAATLFRLGSTTKVFVAATALTLADEGRLDLHRPISAYVPDLPPRLARLTMHQLLTHTAGLFDDTPMKGPADPGALGQTVRSWTDEAVFLEPGRFFSYSNPGYWLAGHVIERVEGRPFAEVVKARVLDPVGMAHSTFHPEEAARHSCAAPHGRGGEIRPAPNHAGTWPSGSLYSSAQDLARFLNALLNDGMLGGRRVFPRSVIRQLKTSWVDIVEPRGQRYGYGLMHHVVAGESLLFHAGSRAGYGSYLLAVPSRGFAIVTLTNRSGAMLGDWTRTAAQELLGITVPEPGEDRADRRTLTESVFRPLLGLYENPPRIRYELFNSKLVPWTREGGQLFSKRGPMRMPVHQVALDRFTDGVITFTLTRDARGEPAWLHAEYKTLVRRRRTRRAPTDSCSPVRRRPRAWSR